MCAWPLPLPQAHSRVPARCICCAGMPGFAWCRKEMVACSVACARWLAPLPQARSRVPARCICWPRPRACLVRQLARARRCIFPPASLLVRACEMQLLCRDVCWPACALVRAPRSQQCSTSNVQERSQPSFWIDLSPSQHLVGKGRMALHGMQLPWYAIAMVLPGIAMALPGLHKNAGACKACGSMREFGAQAAQPKSAAILVTSFFQSVASVHGNPTCPGWVVWHN